MASKLKNNMLTAFVGGELTPALAGRVDKDEASIGSRFLSNFMPQVQGGLKKFYGSSKIATVTETVSDGTYKLVPFDGAIEPLVLVFVGGAVYVATSAEYYKLPFPVPSSQINNCSYLQTNDIIRFTSENGGMFELHYYGIIDGKHSFSYFNPDFLDVPYFSLGWQGNYYGQLTTEKLPYDNSTAYSGSISIRSGVVPTSYAIDLPDILSNAGAEKNITFENDQYGVITRGDKSQGGPFAANMGETKIKLMRVRGDAEPVVVLEATIGNAKDVSVGLSNTGGGIIIGGGSSTRPPTPSVSWAYYGTLKVISAQQITGAFSRLGEVSLSSGASNQLIFTKLPPEHQDGDRYYIEFSQGASSASNPEAITEGNIDEYKRYLSAPAYTQQGGAAVLFEVTNSFSDLSVVGRRIKFWLQDTSKVIRAWAEGIAYTLNEIVYSDGNYYRAMSNNTSGTVQPTHTSGSKSDGNMMWQYLHSGYGTATITSVTSNTEMVARVDGYLPILEWGKEKYYWDNFQWSMWGYQGKWPNKVFMFKNRLGYTFNTDLYGSYLQLSKTDSYNDFGTEEFGITTDTCAINTLISGHQDNRINWVLPGYRLYMGSYSGEYNVTGGSSGAISPSACYILPVSTIGGAPVDAIKYEELNVFVGCLGTEIYSLRYDYTTDDYSPDNVGLAGAKLLEDGIVRLQSLRNADRNIYYVTGKKELRFMNNVKEVGLLGFYRTNFDGEVLDIATSNSGAVSTAFVMVRRGDVTTIEKIDSANPTYMLSCRTFDYTGEEEVAPEVVVEKEFANKDVYVKDLETGVFYKEAVDADGNIKIRTGFRLFNIGLPLLCEAHLTPATGEKVEGLQQKPIKFIVRLLDSGAFKYGSSHDYSTWYNYNEWAVQDGQKWNSGHQLITGDICLPASFGYTSSYNQNSKYPNSTSVGLNICSDTPEPFNLLMVSNIYV